MTRILTAFRGTKLNENMKKSEKKPEKDLPNKPEKHIPAKPDINPDPTRHPSPEKVDPTRIDNPEKVDPTRIDPNPDSNPPKQ
ncbi:MAG TPA: hypothetical protein VNZ49_15030 [Bacteroidia bacterium]|jgi:hypothetical protein|nr:hypothetical protein [Bacteroidia bacterium]